MIAFFVTGLFLAIFVLARFQGYTQVEQLRREHERQLFPEGNPEPAA